MDSLPSPDTAPCSEIPVFFVLPPEHPRSLQPSSASKHNSVHRRKQGNRVLIVGRLLELAIYRAEALDRAGFKVSTATDTDDALRVMRRGDFDAIVLSYTLPNEIVARLTDAAREYCPDCPVIAITESSVLDRRIAPDAVALASDGSAGLVAAVSRVLRAS